MTVESNYLIATARLSDCLKSRPSDRVREKKKTLRAFLEANCAGQKVNCAGNCEGLRNLASKKIFRIPVKG